MKVEDSRVFWVVTFFSFLAAHITPLPEMNFSYLCFREFVMAFVHPYYARVCVGLYVCV